MKMQGQHILAIRLVSDAETKIKNFKYNHCWHSCNLNGTFCDCGSQFDQQYVTSHPSKESINKYEDSLIVNKKSNDTKIGVVCASFSNYEMTLKDFRKLMEKQIDELPTPFIFLYHNGYPVSFKQEQTIKLKNILSADGIVDIKRKFESTRYGIMSVYGEIFGFVFLNPSSSVNSIRSNIIKNLQEIHSFKSMQNDFFFVDRNGWPINHGEQEYNLIGWDIICDNMIRIKPYKIDTKVSLSSSELELNASLKRSMNERNGSTITLFEETNHVDGTILVNNSNNSSEEEHRQHQPIEDQYNQPQLINQQLQQQPPPYITNNNSLVNLSNYTYPRHTYNVKNHPHFYSNSPDVLNNSLNDSFYKQHNLINDQTLVKSQSVRHKPILISYVRKEAEQHARNLKTQLTELGCDVYLDVDEITVGMDWFDSLNEAVNSCEIFIPLVTPNYGLTLWTNRECKLADMKEKFILPINFLRQWPPTVLAIQFATTQFLPWKTKEEFEEEEKCNLESSRATNDMTHWDDRYIRRTAQQINELIKKRTLEKTYLNDELSINENNATGDEDNTNDEQTNSLENSTDDNTETDGSNELKQEDNVKDIELDLIKTENQDVHEVDSRQPSTENEETLVLKADQVNNYYKINKKSLAFKPFNTLSLFNNNFSSLTDVFPLSNHNFNENILTNLTTKSKKGSDCENQIKLKRSKRSFNQPDIQRSKDKNLIAISAHPAQKSVVDSLKEKLSAYFNVWSSTDMIQTYASYNPTAPVANNVEKENNKDEFDRLDKFSTSLNSLSSSATNSIDMDQEIINDSSNLSTQISSFKDQLLTSKLYHEPNTSIDINTSDQTVLCHRGNKPSSKFDKYFYRNQVTKSIGNSKWYIDTADFNSRSCILQPEEIDKVNIFKEKVNQARVIIILLSEDYCDSKTSKGQAYYCDFRKVILPINLEHVKNEAHWVGKLMDNPYLIQKSDCKSEIEMIDKVCHKIFTILKDEEKLNCQLTEKKTEEFAEFIQKKLTVYNKKKLYIYVLGSTKFENQSTKELCEKMGRCLAKKEKIILVTGGAKGVSNTLAQSFYEERKRIRNGNRKVSNTINQDTENIVLHCNSNSDDQTIDIDSLDVIHILPKGQVGDLKNKYHAKDDGTFEPIPYGHTVFLGETIEDRDCTVSRVFPFCILIGGGKSSAKLAQNFIFWDNIVIPICNTGGAAAGHFISEEDCGNNMLEIPAGVDEDDWINLNKSDLPICELGNTIFNIIDCLSKYHLSTVRCKLFDTFNKNIYKKKKSSHKKLNEVFNPFNQIFKT